MPTYVFLNNETGEIEEHFMSYTVLDEFKETNPHLKQQVTGANIVSGVATNFKVDDGFKEVLSKVGDAHPNVHAEHGTKDIKREKSVKAFRNMQNYKQKKIMTELRTQTIEIHELENLDLSTVSEKGQRFYTDSTGKIKYPSVTTVVGLKNREQIKLWRERVGSEEANRITKYATNRGTNFHEKVEQYLRKEVPYIEFDNLIEEGMFKGIKPVLDEITPIALESLCIQTI